MVKKDYGIDEFIPMEDRYYGIKEMASMWCLALASPVIWNIGAIYSVYGLKKAILVYMIAALIGYSMIAAVGRIGYYVPSTTMGLGRASFGIRGAILPSTANYIQLQAWSGFNAYISAGLLAVLVSEIVGCDNQSRSLLILLSLAIIAIATGVVFIGPRAIAKMQVIGATCAVFAILYILFIIIKSISLQDMLAWNPLENPSNEKYNMSFGAGLDVIAAHAFGWTVCAVDYTRYAKSKAVSSIVSMISCTFGMLLTVVIGASCSIIVASKNGGFLDLTATDLAYIFKNLELEPPIYALILAALCCMNVININSSAYALISMRPKWNRSIVVIVVAVLAMGVAMLPVLMGSFYVVFKAFLKLLGIMLPPCTAVMLVDFYILKKKNYIIEELDNSKGIYWYKKGFNFKALFSWVFGVMIYFVGKNIGVVADTTGAVLCCFIATGLFYIVANYNKTLL